MTPATVQYKKRQPFLSTGWILLSPSVFLLVLLLVLPLCVMVAYTFFTRLNIGVEQASFQFGNWKAFLGDDYYQRAIWKTLRVATLSTVVCVVVGYVPAYTISMSTFRRRWVLLMLLMLPFWISFVVRTMSWIQVLGADGIVNAVLLHFGLIKHPLEMLYTEGAVVMGLVHYLLPFAILNIYVSLEGLDRDLIAAARTLGASAFETFFAVTFPLSVPGVATAALLAFMLSAGSYITPLLLGGPNDRLFGNLIYTTTMVELNLPMGATLAIAFVILMSIVVMVYNRYFGINSIAKGIA